jgi:hypothetical protein
MNESEKAQQRNPLRELIEKLTPDTSAKLKSLVLPPRVGLVFHLGPYAYRVSSINAGQLRFSCEFYGMVLPEEGIVRPGGLLETPQETAERMGPAPPKSVTLQVHNSSVDGAAIFGGRHGQNKAD